MRFAIGVDLGGTNLRIAAIDELGRVLDKVTTGTQVKLGRDAVIAEMATYVEQVSAKLRDSADLIGIGIGVPGIIDQRTGLLRESPNLPGWADYPVVAAIEKRVHTAVVVENDANAAALGESWLGAAKSADNMCIVTLGTGVGGGIVQRGQVWRGMSGMAGEIGHVTVDPNGPKCNCGNYGCCETYASATAIVRMAREAIDAGHAPELARIAASPNRKLNAKTVHDLALQGDQPARAILAKVGWSLGILLADLVNVLNLDMYVIAGGVSAAWDSFAPSLFHELAKRSMVYAATAPACTSHSASPAEQQNSPGGLRSTVVARALLGSDAGLYGAARLPLSAETATLSGICGTAATTA